MVIRGIVAAVAAALLAGPAIVSAKGLGLSAGAGASAGAGLGSGSVSAKANLNSNAPGSVDRDKGTDRAMDRRSDAGNRNANNPGQPDRDKGLARAEDRHEMKSSVFATTRDKRMADAYARWQLRTK